jgi:hypothetical protein
VEFCGFGVVIWLFDEVTECALVVPVHTDTVVRPEVRIISSTVSDYGSGPSSGGTFVYQRVAPRAN